MDEKMIAAVMITSALPYLYWQLVTNYYVLQETREVKRTMFKKIDEGQFSFGWAEGARRRGIQKRNEHFRRLGFSIRRLGAFIL